MSKKLPIRALQQHDWQPYAKIRLRSLHEGPGMYGSNFAKESMMQPEDWQKWLTSPTGEIYGAHDNDKLIGTACVSINRECADQGIIWGFYVDPEYRGRGLGVALLQFCMGWAQQRPDLKKLRVGHRNGNEASQRAIQAAAFKFVGKELDLFGDGTTTDHWHYEIDLEEIRKAS